MMKGERRGISASADIRSPDPRCLTPNVRAPTLVPSHRVKIYTQSLSRHSLCSIDLRQVNSTLAREQAWDVHQLLHSRTSHPLRHLLQLVTPYCARSLGGILAKAQQLIAFKLLSSACVHTTDWQNITGNCYKFAP